MTAPMLSDDPWVATLSPSAQRLLRRPRPRFRGVLHLWAARASVPVGIVLVLGADGTRSRLSLAAFALGTTLMFAVSAMVHDRDWSASEVERLVRLDHTAIFLKFATTATPIALLGLDAPESGWMLAVVWTGSIVGMVAEWVPIHPPHGVVNALYLTFGWSLLAFTPWLLTSMSGRELALLFAGGAAYTVGAIVVGARWPDPWTDVFGYHEIWHAFVVVAVACHYGMAASLGW